MPPPPPSLQPLPIAPGKQSDVDIHGDDENSGDDNKFDLNSKPCTIGDPFDHLALAEIIANWRKKFMEENHVKLGQLIQVS